MLSPTEKPSVAPLKGKKSIGDSMSLMSPENQHIMKQIIGSLKKEDGQGSSKNIVRKSRNKYYMCMNQLKDSGSQDFVTHSPAEPMMVQERNTREHSAHT